MSKKSKLQEFATTQEAQFGDVAIATTFSRKGKVLDVVVSQPETEGEGTTPIASMIDHTLLKADATQEQILKLCQEAAVSYTHLTLPTIYSV